MDKEEPVKSVKLYTQPETVYQDLKELGLSDTDTLDEETLSAFDQLHYYGTESVTNAINSLAIKASDRVLDVGSGLGGTSRYIAHKTGCHVTAVELQENLHQVAVNLTQRCRLEDRVLHICGNFLDIPNDVLKDFDYVVSWMAVIHIDDKERVLDRCFQALKPSGKLYLEEFISIGTFTDEEKYVMRRDVAIPVPPTTDEYNDLIVHAGFSHAELVDVTDDWRAFVRSRMEKYRADEERNKRVHGEEAYERYNYFYTAIAAIFSGGKLGGCLITATK